MTLKCTWCWNGSAADGDVSYGFSETWYTADAPDVVVPKMEAVARLRVKIMASGAVLHGMRIGDVAPNSRAFTVAPSTPIRAPAGNGTPNIPQDAALCVCYGAVANTVKRFFFHNLADSDVINAAFNPADAIESQCTDIVKLLANSQFQFRYLPQNLPTAPIGTISAAGAVNLRTPLVGSLAGAIVQLYHVKGVDGRGKRGKFLIDAWQDTSNFHLFGWAGGQVVLSGSLRLVSYSFTNIRVPPRTGIGSVVALRPGARKCGRPFGMQRGRAVARR
jgi:hypothetical protein